MMARETGSIEQFIFLSDVVAFIPTTPSRRTITPGPHGMYSLHRGLRRRSGEYGVRSSSVVGTICEGPNVAKGSRGLETSTPTPSIDFCRRYLLFS